MAVRNFWITTRADGAQTAQATGPRAKDGGFTTKVQQRDAGSVTTACELQGFASADGTLRLQVVVNGAIVWEQVTTR